MGCPLPGKWFSIPNPTHASCEWWSHPYLWRSGCAAATYRIAVAGEMPNSVRWGVGGALGEGDSAGDHQRRAGQPAGDRQVMALALQVLPGVGQGAQPERGSADWISSTSNTGVTFLLGAGHRLPQHRLELARTAGLLRLCAVRLASTCATPRNADCHAQPVQRVSQPDDESRSPTPRCVARFPLPRRGRARPAVLR